MRRLLQLQLLRHPDLLTVTISRQSNWLLLVTVGASLALTSCSSGQASGPPGLDYREIAAEYSAETNALVLPEGTTFPDKEYDPEGTYQAGVGRNDADSFWYCSWADEYLSTTGPQQAAALEQLMTLKSQYIYTDSYDDGTRQIVDNLLSAAGLGDPGPLQRDYEINCQ